jgi:anti-sigma regulatory factor (Ser/Thr protein kinase)
MVEDICFHIIDLVQNSAAAGAKVVRVEIRDSLDKNELLLVVSDDGRGMDQETVARAQDPFYTSKSFKKVGLGIPLLKATAQSCHGDFAINSEPGQGTTVQARLERQHIDCPPLGNLVDTMLTLIVSMADIDLRFVYENDRGRFAIATSEIRAQVGDLHLSHPDVYQFLRQYIGESLEKLHG